MERSSESRMAKEIIENQRKRTTWKKCLNVRAVGVYTSKSSYYVSVLLCLCYYITVKIRLEIMKLPKLAPEQMKNKHIGNVKRNGKFIKNNGSAEKG